MGDDIRSSHCHVRPLARQQSETAAGVAEERHSAFGPMRHDDLSERVEIDRFPAPIHIERLTGDPAGALEFAAHESESLLRRNPGLIVAKCVGRGDTRRIDGIERDDPMLRLVEVERMADVKRVVIEMKGGDIAAEKPLELSLLTEDETTDARMHAICAKDKVEGLLAAVVENDADLLAAVAKRACLTAEPDSYARGDGMVVKNALQIGAQKIEILVAQSVTDSVDRNRLPDGTVRTHELESVDGIMNAAEFGHETHSLGHVP